MSSIKAGEAYVEVSVKGADRVELALSKIQKTAGSVNSAVKRLAASFAGLNNAVAYAFRNISSFAADFGTIGDVYDKASGRLGISAQALSEFDFAAQRCGADLGAVEGAVKNIQKKLAEAKNGSESAATAFEQLGLSVSEIAALSPERQFEAVARAVGAIQDPSLRAGAALRLMRDSGQKLLPLFNEGPDGLRKLREEAQRLGASFSDDNAKIGAGYVDAITNLKASVQGLKNALSEALVPAMIKACETLTEYLVTVREWLRTHRETVENVKNAAQAFAPYVAQIFAAAAAFKSLRAVPIIAKVPAQWLAIAAAIGAATLALREWRKRLDDSRGSQWSEAAQEKFKKGEEDREDSKKDLERLKVLREISKEHELSASQIAEAQALVQKLRDAYGDVGFEVDKTTGKIKLATDAQNELNKRMLESKKQELEAALAEAQNNANYHTIALKIAGETDVSLADKLRGNGSSTFMERAGALVGLSHDEQNLMFLQGNEEFEKKVKIQYDKARSASAALRQELDALNKRLEDAPDAPMDDAIESEEEYQKKLDERKKALDDVAEYEKKRADENSSALQRELKRIDDETNAYRNQLRTLRELTAEELKRKEARAKKIADAAKVEDDPDRKKELQTELDSVNLEIKQARADLASFDEKDRQASVDMQKRRDDVAQNTVDDWNKKYGKTASENDDVVDLKRQESRRQELTEEIGKTKNKDRKKELQTELDSVDLNIEQTRGEIAAKNKDEIDQFRAAIQVKMDSLSDEFVRLTMERATTGDESLDEQIQAVEKQLDDLKEQYDSAEKVVVDKKIEEQDARDRATDVRIANAAERFMAPAERFQLAAGQLDQALVDLAAAQDSGDREQIAAALERLGEAQDKYENAASASTKIADSVKSLGGSFDAWQAASLSTKSSTETKLYDETRTQTRYLAEIARRVGVAAFG